MNKLPIELVREICKYGNCTLRNGIFIKKYEGNISHMYTINFNIKKSKFQDTYHIICNKDKGIGIEYIIENDCIIFAYTRYYLYFRTYKYTDKTNSWICIFHNF